MLREYKSNNNNRVRNLHPCFGAVGSKARIHLPLCPACNIECAFCKRCLNDDEQRPGVAAFVLKPEDAADYVSKAIALCPEISVVGVAGPGDTLVGDNLFRAFSAVSERFPSLLKCISTNGLLLERRAEELIALGIDTLTVTVNAVDPVILSRIVPVVRWEGRRLSGLSGGELLIRNQLAGIRKMARAGTTIKINTVLVPGVNDSHIGAVAREVARAGATIHNIIPLIPQYLLTDVPEPTCAQIEEARGQAAPYINVFRHCMHCRADAVGIPGFTDFSKELFREFSGQAEEVFSHG